MNLKKHLARQVPSGICESWVDAYLTSAEGKNAVTQLHVEGICDSSSRISRTKVRLDMSSQRSAELSEVE